MCDISFLRRQKMFMQKQPSKRLFKKAPIRNIAEFTSKHMRESFFFDKVKLYRSAASSKARLVQVFFCEF